jgi:hypothetical protein
VIWIVDFGVKDKDGQILRYQMQSPRLPVVVEPSYLEEAMEGEEEEAPSILDQGGKLMFLRKGYMARSAAQYGLNGPGVALVKEHMPLRMIREMLHRD